ncbi:hypothetical protein LUX33_41160 [Actinomadura madurae]|nr:hypothetical protein [Actinomadura madurae]MCP9954197.1 hypothetical protein [Actinomadura madurae]MCP9970948.1 hypothetical protein [Actinomadura madurae]MCQ0005009.1 hypothetical protein [Actinomadura madurae]
MNQSAARGVPSGPTGRTEMSRAGTWCGSRGAVRKARASAAGSAGGGPATTRPVGARTWQWPTRSRTAPSPVPSTSRRCRSRTAVRSAARAPDRCRTTSSVTVANATSSGTLNSGMRWRRHASTRSPGMAPSARSHAARPETPAPARARTNASESAGPVRQTSPVSTSSRPRR